MLSSAPRHLRDSYEAEVQRLELAVKRAESVVNKERMDRIQRGALSKVSKMEKEKQRQGKGKWFLKKRELFEYPQWPNSQFHFSGETRASDSCEI